MKIDYLKTTQDIENVSRYVSNYLLEGALSGYGYLYGERRYSIAKKCKHSHIKYDKTQKLKDFAELKPYLPPNQILSVYNMLYNPKAINSELILAPHQESINL